MYRPHYKEALQMYERIINKHPEDLAKLDLIWEPIQCPDGGWAICPFVVADFKGAV